MAVMESTSTLLRRSLAEGGNRSISMSSGGMVHGNEKIATGIRTALKDDLASDVEKVIEILREVDSQAQFGDIESRYHRKYGHELISDLENDLSVIEMEELSNQCTSFIINRPNPSVGALEYLETYIDRSFGPTSVSRQQLSAHISDDAVCKSILAGQAGDDGKSTEVLQTLMSKITREPDKEVSQSQWLSAVRKTYTEVDNTTVSPRNGFEKSLQFEKRMGGLNTSNATPGNSIVEKSTMHTPMSLLSHHKDVHGDPISVIMEDDNNNKSLSELADDINNNITSALQLTVLTSPPLSCIGSAKHAVLELVNRFNQLRVSNSELLESYKHLKHDSDISLGNDVIFEQRINNLEADRNDLRKEIDEHLIVIQSKDENIKSLELELESQKQQCRSLIEVEDALKIHARMAEDRAREAESRRDDMLHSNNEIRDEVVSEFEPQIRERDIALSNINEFLTAELSSLLSREAEHRLAIQDHSYDNLFKIFGDSRSQTATKTSEKQQQKLRKEIETAKERANDLELIENQLKAALQSLEGDLQETKGNHEDAVNQMTKAHAEIVQNMTDEHTGNVQQINREHDEAVQQMSKKHENGIKQMSVEHEDTVQQLSKKHDNTVKQKSREHDDFIRQISNEHEGIVRQLSEEHKDKVKNISNEHEGAVQQMSQEHLQTENKQKQDLEAKIKRLNNESDDLRKDRDMKTKQLENLLRESDATRLQEEHGKQQASEAAADLTRQLQSAKADSSNLRSELDFLQKQVSKLENNAKDAEAERASLTENDNATSSRLREAEEQLAEKDEKNTALRQHLDAKTAELESEIQKQQNENKSLAEKLRDCQDDDKSQIMKAKLERELKQAQEQLDSNIEKLRDSDGKDNKIKQLLQTIEKQARELELLRKQLRQVYGAAHAERSLHDLVRAQEDDRETIERQQVKGKKYLERYWRRIEMPFGAEGSLQIKVKGPSKTDPEPAVVISEVVPGGAADKAGVTAGGLIIRVRNPIGNWSVITRSDFLQTIGPRGHVFENVELSLFVIHDEKFIAEWRKRLLEYVKQEDRQKSSGSWIGRMRGKYDSNHVLPFYVLSYKFIIKNKKK